MNFFLLGRGRVGTALYSFFLKQNIKLSTFNTGLKKKTGVLFAALSDTVVAEEIKKIRIHNPELHIIHFSAASLNTDELCFLLHPFASISKKTDISEIIFTLWGKKNLFLENELRETGLKFVYSGKSNSLFYHISAVFSGNFTQYFYCVAMELLNNEGFSETESRNLLKQLILSSLQNCEKSGINGLTGPASRGDTKVVLDETEILRTKNPEIAGLFLNINNMIEKAVRNGYIFKR